MAIALQVGWHGPNSASSSARGSPQPSHWLHGGGRKRPWSEDSEEMLQLMMGQFERRKETLDLLGGSSHSSSSSSSSSSAGPLELLESEPDKPLPCGWEKCLDLKTGAVYYMNSTSGAKTLDDPRDSTSLPSNTTKASSTNLNDRPASTLFRNKSKDASAALRDDLNLSSLANLFLKQSSMQTTPPRPHMATLLLNSKPKFEDEPSLHEGAISSLTSEGKLSTDPSKKRINPILANHAVLDIGLELNLNLSTFKSAVTEQKPLNLNDQCNNIEVQERRVAQKVSLLSESTSSSHSIWRLQTREDSVYSAINYCYEAEKPKVEDNPPNNNNNNNNNMMVIMGCPCCLMYVMLWKSEPKCPKCGSFVINTDFPSSSAPSLAPPHKPLSFS